MDISAEQALEEVDALETLVGLTVISTEEEEDGWRLRFDDGRTIIVPTPFWIARLSRERMQ